MNLHHIFHTCAQSIYEKLVIYLNEAALSVIYELLLVNYLKLLVLTTYDGSNSSETIFSRTINDLHVVMLDFSKVHRIQIAILMLYIF